MNPEYYNGPSSALSVVRLLASTQTQIDVFSDQLIDSVKQGEANPIEVLVQLKAMEKVIGRVLKEIQPNFVTESEKHPEKSFEFNGAKIEKAEVGTSYDFSVCRDVEFERLETDFNTAKARLDERKEFLKAIKKPLPMVNEDGEAVTIYPPNKTSTTSLRVTIK